MIKYLFNVIILIIRLIFSNIFFSKDYKSTTYIYNVLFIFIMYKSTTYIYNV